MELDGRADGKRFVRDDGRGVVVNADEDLLVALECSTNPTNHIAVHSIRNTSPTLVVANINNAIIQVGIGKVTLGRHRKSLRWTQFRA